MLRDFARDQARAWGMGLGAAFVAWALAVPRWWLPGFSPAALVFGMAALLGAWQTRAWNLGAAAVAMPAALLAMVHGDGPGTLIFLPLAYIGAALGAISRGERLSLFDEER